MANDKFNSVCRALVQAVWDTSRTLSEDNGPMGTATKIALRCRTDPTELTIPLHLAIRTIAYDSVKTGWEHHPDDENDWVCAIKGISTDASSQHGILVVFLDESDYWCDVSQYDGEQEELVMEICGLLANLERDSKELAIDAYYRKRTKHSDGTHFDNPTLVQWSDNSKYEVVPSSSLLERDRKYTLLGTLKELDDDRFGTL